MNLSGEEAGKEQTAAIQTIGYGERICAFYARD